ncbi:MAG: PASTA domain-containing protein [Actinomycetota bacterium]
MIDPSEQLRRLAEHRSEQVEPFTVDELERPHESSRGAVVLPFLARRWPSAIAAGLLLLVALAATAFAVLGGDGDDDEIEQAVADPDRGTLSTLLDASAVPDVVGLTPEEAAAALEDRGLEPQFSVLWVDEDELLGSVVAQSLPVDLLVAEGETVVLQVARPAPTTLSTDPCQRPAHLLGIFDDDRLVDAVHSRTDEDGRINEVEVCTAAGSRPVAYDMDFERLAAVTDLDGDGLDEIVGARDGTGTRSGILAIDGRELVVVDADLAFGPRGDGVNDWWGCHAFSANGIERLATGTWTVTEAGTVVWDLVEQNVVGDQLVAGAADDGEEPVGAIGPPGRGRCETTVDGEPPLCDISEAAVAMTGDLDGDGIPDWIAPRDDLICFGDLTIATIGSPVADADLWFLDDIDDDGRMELFAGTSGYGSIDMRPWRLDDGRVFVPAAEEGCCVQHLPRQILPEDEATFVGRWFSCVDAIGDIPGELVSGRFWHAGPIVEWSIDVGTVADPDIRYRADVGDPRETDAWRPGNGCRGTSPRWREPVTFAFGDDGRASDADLAAFNAWVASDDVDRRHVRLREALGVADLLGEGETYAEDIEAATITISGLRDDSVAAVRFVVTYDETGTAVTAIERQQACQPERGPDDLTTELCL